MSVEFTEIKVYQVLNNGIRYFRHDTEDHKMTCKEGSMKILVQCRYEKNKVFTHNEPIYGPIEFRKALKVMGKFERTTWINPKDRT
jgi:hypothetical protein